MAYSFTTNDSPGRVLFETANSTNSIELAPFNNFFDKTFTTHFLSKENTLLKEKALTLSPLDGRSLPMYPFFKKDLKLDDLNSKPRKNLLSSTSIVGFKKALNSRVKIRNMLLEPGYNRRKYSHTHFTQTKSQCTKLSKTYAYLSSAKVKNLIGFVLKNCYPTHKDLLLSSQLSNQVQNTKACPPLYAFLKPTMDAKLRASHGQASKVSRPVPFLVSLLERDYHTILWRNQFCLTLRSARQWMNHHKTPGFASYGQVFQLDQ